MSAAGPVFVTPHAVHQFRARVKLLSYNDALAAILHGLIDAFGQRQDWPISESGCVTVRARRPFGFRAVIRPAGGAGLLPTVVTVKEG